MKTCLTPLMIAQAQKIVHAILGAWCLLVCHRTD
jgi:hypothetical protein